MFVVKLPDSLQAGGAAPCKLLNWRIGSVQAVGGEQSSWVHQVSRREFHVYLDP